MQHSSSHTLQSLLSVLDDKKPESSIMSVVNATTIDLMGKLLSIDPKNYGKIAEKLSDCSESDINNMLDFMLCLVCNGHLLLMIKIITKTPVIPTSLIVTGVSRPAEHDYIGSGGFGDVYKGKLGEESVALKVLYKANNNVAFCREALIWGSLKHKFVLQLLGIYEFKSETASRFFLVSPFMKNGTLSQWRKKASPSIAEIEKRMVEVAQGVEYIHSEGAAHGDLRGENILLDTNFQVQIADFGLTRLSEATATRSRALYHNFAAPELFEDDAAVKTQKSDVYAFGCLYYEIHYDIMPFAGKTELQILRLISEGTRPHRRDEPPLNDKAWKLIQSCWAEVASERPDMEDVAIAIQSKAQAPFQRGKKKSSKPPFPGLYPDDGTPLYADLPGSFGIHPFLNGETPKPDFMFNLTSPLHFSPMRIIHGLSVPLSAEVLAQPAMHPTIYYLRIVCDETPDWQITLKFDPNSYREHTGTTSPYYVPPISLGDMLSAIHRTLQEQITHADWARLDITKQNKVNQAYINRCKATPTMESLLKGQGVKKVDYLLDKVWFKGLVGTDNGPTVLKLVVSQHK